MASKEQLTHVFNDTVNLIESGKYSDNLPNELLDNKKINLKVTKSSCNITVDNEDCIKIANNLSLSGKTCLLNMASYKRPGGGVRNGSMAQEEELCRRSNLIYGLPNEYYPLSVNQFIYTEGVTFFKDKHYNIMDSFDCDVITMAAINLNNGTPFVSKPKSYESDMINKIKNMLWYPSTKGCNNLVLSAFGCGVFRNDPNYVANLFLDILNSGYSCLYKNISFAIINDRNSVSSNFEIFKKIIQSI